MSSEKAETIGINVEFINGHPYVALEELVEMYEEEPNLDISSMLTQLLEKAYDLLLKQGTKV